MVPIIFVARDNEMFAGEEEDEEVKNAEQQFRFASARKPSGMVRVHNGAMAVRVK